jgi:hypothetical protein
MIPPREQPGNRRPERFPGSPSSILRDDNRLEYHSRELIGQGGIPGGLTSTLPMDGPTAAGQCTTLHSGRLCVSRHGSLEDMRRPACRIRRVVRGRSSAPGRTEPDVLRRDQLPEGPFCRPGSLGPAHHPVGAGMKERYPRRSMGGSPTGSALQQASLIQQIAPSSECRPFPRRIGGPRQLHLRGRWLLLPECPSG